MWDVLEKKCCDINKQTNKTTKELLVKDVAEEMQQMPASPGIPPSSE
jgi:hypothetical protein